jgi:hypothetical protein
MLAGGLTLVVDGIVSYWGTSGASYRAYRIFITAGGSGMNRVVGRAEIICGLVVALFSIGVFRDRLWGWVVAVIVGLMGLGGLTNPSIADRVFGALSVVMLILALQRHREWSQFRRRSHF